MKRLKTAGLLLTVALVLVLIGSAVVGLFPSAESAAEPQPEPVTDGQRLRVEVLNGSGLPGLARTATRILRRQNFDVVYFGNAPGNATRDSSVVIDRVGRTYDAERLADALGIRYTTSEPDSTLYLDATVILGRDWPANGGQEVPPAER